jgi:hypothetical protein
VFANFGIGTLAPWGDGHFAQSAALGNERLASTPNERVNAFHLFPRPMQWTMTRANRPGTVD